MKGKRMKGENGMSRVNDSKTDEQAQLAMLKGVLDRMNARGRKEPDPNSDDAQERVDAVWLAEMREAKAEADELARDEYQEALNLLDSFGFFHSEAGVFIQELLDEATFEVDAGVLDHRTTLDLTVSLPADESARAIADGVLRLARAGFAESVRVAEGEDIDCIAELSFELRPASVVQAADFLTLCHAP